MTTALLNFGRRFLSLSWLTGPIFEKELRVSSRRRRNYVLRFGYLGLLTISLVLTWLAYVPRGGTGVYGISRMAEAGKAITVCLVWFQFIAAQLVGLTMLSTSISDEVYNRTLGLLMTTPISSFQIVTGKLFSKLLQLLLLLAISLPLLAIVRVFGGVPWGYVISSLCITVTAVVFVGLLSLFFSIFSRRAYVVIILTTLTLGVTFLLLPFLAAYMLHRVMSEGTLFSIFTFPNPYFTLFFNTMLMMEPRAMMGGFAFYWPVHCGVMLGASGLLLFLSVLLVRRVGLRQATGQSGVSPRKRRGDREAGVASLEQPRFAVAPRRVRGPAVLWKELRFPVFGRRKIGTLIAIAVGLIVLFITYALCANENILDDEQIQVMYAVIFAGLGMLFTIIIPATCITSEKESQCWPLLLATTLTGWQVIFGKFGGVLRRCLPIWCVLFGHIVLFTLTGVIHPVAIIQCAILVAWILAFLCGAGLYFSARFRHTTTAVIANFALAASVWGLAPLLMVVIAGITGTRAGYDWAVAYIDTNPFVHAGILVGGAMRSFDSYWWPGLGSLNAAKSTIWMLICMLSYMFLGLLFAWRAKCRMRRNIF